ncbi:MAG: ABC transporter permease [Acidobacteriota bacterium]
MLEYALRRLMAAIPLLWLIWTLTFVIGHLAPGDPLALYQGPNISRESLDTLRHVYGLDAPLPVQYLKQLGALLTGHYPLSTSQGRPVAEIIGEACGPTLLLISLALAVQFLFGTLLGLLTAVRRGGGLDHGVSAISLFFYSIPTFWLGVELVLLFSYRLGWFPPSQMRDVTLADPAAAGWMVDLLRHLALPVLTLGLGGLALTTRHMRSSLLEVIGLDYVRTARAQGLPEWRVIGRHALRNALMPLVTLAGLSLPVLFSGTVVVEVIFSWPGMGQVAFNAILARDYPLIQAVTLMTAALVVAGSLLADIAAAAVDPRVRLGHQPS